MTDDLRSIVSQFQIPGRFIEAKSFGSGHIHDTYAVIFKHETAAQQYLLQRINQNVFKKPLEVMENIQRVTSHISKKLFQNGETDIERKVPVLVPTNDAHSCFRDDQGAFWRVYILITNAYTCEIIGTPSQAFEAAKTFGLFQKQLVDLPGPRLHETIVDFHNTPKRFAVFEQACKKDPCGRVALAKPEIDFIFFHKDLASALTDLQNQGAIPERITHNDTKVNNVLLDSSTHKGLCAIDLDTVMPGIALNDVGDMIRSMTSPVDEDTKDISAVCMQMTVFKAIAEGYLSTAGDFLNETEKEHLSTGGKVITFEQAMRFLTDYLNGDTYYKTEYDYHNLIRARTQIKLIESIIAQEKEMKRFVEKL
jgi:thiamine kinase-like enzyme